MIDMHLNKNFKNKNIKKQMAGYVVLLVSVVLLLSLTLVSLFAGQALSAEGKIAGNTYRSEQAFEAAQAGLEYGINYAQTNQSTITNGQTLTGTLANNSTYSVVLNFVGGTNATLNVVSTGTNADGTATRVIKQIIISNTSSSSIPPNSVISRGNMSMSNNAAVKNLFGSTTILSGGTVTMKNNANTVLASGVSSQPGSYKADIVQNNTGLSGLSDTALQTTYVGAALTGYASSASASYAGSGTKSYNSQLSGQTNKVIYINQGGTGTVTVSNNVTIGNSSQPVIIIVIGNVNLNNNITLNGNIYATGNITVGNNTTINGYVFAVGNLTLSNNGVINGAAVVGGTTTAASNNAAINYNPTNLRTNASLLASNYGKLNGSWQDMNL